MRTCRFTLPLLCFTLSSLFRRLESALPLIEENTALNSHLWASSARSSLLGHDVTNDIPPRACDSETNVPLDSSTLDVAPVVTEPTIEIRSAVLDWEEELPPWVHRSVNGAEEVGLDIVM